MYYRNEILNLKNACYNCVECGLGMKKVAGRDPHVFATGKVPANIMFCGEAPGSNEVIEKKPLVGRSGKFYENKILKVAGIERKDVFTTNVVNCRPDDKNRNPSPYEINTCRKHLDAQILLVNPKLLIPMGNIPLYSVMETKGITKMRGRLHWSRKWSDGRKIPVFPIFHPSYCLRGSGHKEMKEDAHKIGVFNTLIKSGKNLEELI